MPKGIIALVMAFALAGCLATQLQQSERVTEVKQAADAAYQACQAQYPETPKAAIARANCINDADAMLKPVVDYPDLLDLKIAKRSEIAEQIADGKITWTEAKLEFSEFVTGLIDEEQKRSLADRSVRAQELSAIAASSPTTCTRIGNSVTCF